MKAVTPIEKVIAVLSHRDARLSFKELLKECKLRPHDLNDAIHGVRLQRPDLMFGKFDHKYWFANTPTWYSNQTDLSKELPLEGEIGMISDTHLCSVADRLDLVGFAYEVFAHRGIRQVFHCGDLTDGWKEYRNHINFVKVHGDQDQAKYVIENFPFHKGIKTYVIGGNHDDSYGNSKIDRVSLVTHGFFHQGKEVKGREDIVYLGQYSHYILFPQEVRMHMIHPRGNQAYALSYRQQKRSEAMSRNERPEIQMSGHYHTYCHVWHDGTHLLALPGLQDETEFFKRLGLPRSLGYTIVRYEIRKGLLFYFAPQVHMIG